MKYVLAVILCLVTSASYGGVSINGTTITFSDATVQTTAKPSDHGGTGNSVSGTDSFIGGGYSNLVTDDYGTIGGGQDNQAGDDAGTTSDRKWATVGGGYLNVASGHSSTIGGGQNNTASGYWSTVSGGFAVFGNTASGDWSTVGGGGLWSNTASGDFSTVSGGNGNTASGESATVGGGGGPAGNTASGDFSTVSGGYHSIASGKHSTVSGGYHSIASGYSSTVGGGYQNMASGDFSFVAGLWANDSGHNNVFVWNDGTGGTASASNTFNVNATNGIFFNGAGVHPSSDRNMKEAFSFVSAREVLDKVVEMPVSTWRFKSEDDSVRHIGPVAQDFMAAFGYGVDDTHIMTTDADGVALAAIQGLNAKLEAKRAEDAEVITALRWHSAQLEARLARLENAILREPEPAQTGTD